jgi:NADH pyrophosphatase NudC (nudix superfamily)
MAEPKFVPKPGQTDYTDIRYCPVINCVVTHKGKVLLVHRSADLRLYPDTWNGISGFLDDAQDIEDKAREELLEEAHIEASQIASIKHGKVLIQDDQDYQKTWIVFPLLMRVNTDKFKLSWEAQDAQWFKPAEVTKLKLVPGFPEVFEQFRKVL